MSVTFFVLMINLDQTFPCPFDYCYGCLRDMIDGSIYGNKTGQTPLVENWDNSKIVAGTRIGLTLDFKQDGTATVTGYKDGVRKCVLSTVLRGPLCPAFWFFETGDCIEFVPSHYPHS